MARPHELEWLNYVQSVPGPPSILYTISRSTILKPWENGNSYGIVKPT